MQSEYIRNSADKHSQAYCIIRQAHSCCNFMKLCNIQYKWIPSQKCHDILHDKTALPSNVGKDRRVAGLWRGFHKRVYVRKARADLLIATPKKGWQY